jgi:hypothetical protein
MLPSSFRCVIIRFIARIKPKTRQAIFGKRKAHVDRDQFLPPSKEASNGADLSAAHAAWKKLSRTNLLPDSKW